MQKEARGQQTRDGIRLFQEVDFVGMRAAGKLAAQILDEIADEIVVGQTTGKIDKLIEQKVTAAGAQSATIGYKGYRHASCISLNHVVCHGIPGDKKLKDGDILNIDVTVIVDGWYGDTSRMFVAGKLDRKSERLLLVISGMRSKVLSKGTVCRWCVISAAMGWDGCFTRRPTCCIMAVLEPVLSFKRACFSRLSQWSIWDGLKPKCWRMTGQR